MAPIIEISNNDFERTKQLLTFGKVKYNLPNSNHKKPSLDDFEYIPSINLYVAKEKTLFGKDFYESQEILHNQGERMLTPFEFMEFLKYAKTDIPKTYEDITEVRSPWRAEWLDAHFKTKENKLYIDYHVFDENGKIIQQSEVLGENTLMENKHISVDSLIENHTNKGLPTKKIKLGDWYYRSPKIYSNSVAGFNASSDKTGMSCYWSPSSGGYTMGVRAVRRE